MQRMVFLMMVVVVMVVAALPYAGAAICYKCQGYNPHLTEDEMTNNKHCPKGDFQKNKVHTSKDIVCIYMVEEMDGTEITVRDVAGIMVTSKKAKTTYINFSGFFCDKDYCNTAPNTRALCLPLLFVPLLASLFRSFA